MKKNQRTQSSQLTNTQTDALLDELDTLLNKTKKIVQKIDEDSNQTEIILRDIKTKVHESITRVEKIYSDLDQIEKETEDELDKLILQQAEILAEE